MPRPGLLAEARVSTTSIRIATRSSGRRGAGHFTSIAPPPWLTSASTPLRIM
jgi:hypothetical protein